MYHFYRKRKTVGHGEEYPIHHESVNKIGKTLTFFQEKKKYFSKRIQASKLFLSFVEHKVYFGSQRGTFQTM